MSAKNILRWLLNVDRVHEDALSVFTGAIARAWTGTEHEIQIGLVKGREGSERFLTPTELAEYTDITFAITAASRTGSALAEATIATGDIDTTLDDESWADGSKQHLLFEFPAGEMELPIDSGETEKRYWFVVTANAMARTLGGGAIDFVRDRDAQVGAVQAGNVVPSNAVYNGSGSYDLAVDADTVYSLVLGANDTSLDNDGQVLSADGYFTSAEYVVTLTGTAGQPVTAQVRPNPAITVQVADARYLRGNGGSLAIGNGVSTVVVTGLNRLTAPTHVLVSVAMPVGGLVLFASVVHSSKTADGFTVNLSGLTDSANYRLDFLAL